jgi:hypothetical protein
MSVRQQFRQSIVIIGVLVLLALVIAAFMLRRVT